jgi:hypothetical protein
MKNLLKTISLLILLTGLFASCKTGSIIKRHYNKGFYVSKKHKPSEPRVAQGTGTEKASTPATAPALEPAVIEKIAAGSEPATEVQIAEPKLNDQSNVKRSEKMENFPKEDGIAASSFSPRKIMTHPFSMRKNLKAAVAQDDVARDALSLLWILILVLLIVYVVGLIFDLFGLGPVFHILGAIVLVLLILWLLRII